MTNMEQRSAFILRIAPSRIDRMDEALKSNELIIGWSRAEGLLDTSLSWEQFREIIQRTCHANDTDFRAAGRGAGNMWRFIRDMKLGDLVVTPYGSEFYVAKIVGPPTYDCSMIEQDTAYRRRVEWLNNGHPIPRSHAKSALIARMKHQGTSAQASDLLDGIDECLRTAGSGESPTFATDLQARLIPEVRKELQSGRIDSYGFERIIKSVLEGLGASQVRIVSRNQDQGADLIAEFLLAGVFKITIAVQAKLWQSNPPAGKDVVAQTIRGVEAESADMGMVVTSGTFSTEAEAAAADYFEAKGVRIELVDGDQFARMIVESGVRPHLSAAE